MLKKVATAAALMAATAGASAQTNQSANWTVTGTITAAPCVLTLSGSQEAAFGTLSNTTVRSWAVEATPPRYSSISSHITKAIPLDVTCSVAGKFALYVTDNQASTMVGPPGKTISFGMGSTTGADATSIGRYVVQYSTLLIKGTASATGVLPAKVLLADGQATAATSSWATAAGDEAKYIPVGKSIAFALTSAATTPDALANVSGRLEVGIEPLKSVVDEMTSDLSLRGSATITLLTL